MATQYKAHSLIRHLQRGWNFFRQERNESFDILPASQRVSDTAWYAGTADAVYQNIDIIESYAPKYMVVLAGDNVYKMDYEQMLQQHVEQNADVTILDSIGAEHLLGKGDLFWRQGGGLLRLADQSHSSDSGANWRVRPLQPSPSL